MRTKRGVGDWWIVGLWDCGIARLLDCAIVGLWVEGGLGDFED